MWKDNEQLLKQNELLLGQPSVQMLFKGYYFDCTLGQDSVEKTGKCASFASSQSTADTANKAK